MKKNYERKVNEKNVLNLQIIEFYFQPLKFVIKFKPLQSVRLGYPCVIYINFIILSLFGNLVNGLTTKWEFLKMRQWDTCEKLKNSFSATKFSKSVDHPLFGRPLNNIRSLETLNKNTSIGNL